MTLNGLSEVIFFIVYLSGSGVGGCGGDGGGGSGLCLLPMRADGKRDAMVQILTLDGLFFCLFSFIQV